MILLAFPVEDLDIISRIVNFWQEDKSVSCFTTKFTSVWYFGISCIGKPKLDNILRPKLVIYIVVAKYAYYYINNNINYIYNHFGLLENKCKHD